MAIINSILWYVSISIDCMTTYLLVKVVSEFYSESDILNAKKELFKKVIINGKTQRLIKRQGDNNNDVNIKDILEFLHLLDAYTKDNPSSKPVYASATSTSLL